MYNYQCIFPYINIVSHCFVWLQWHHSVHVSSKTEDVDWHQSWYCFDIAGWMCIA